MATIRISERAAALVGSVAIAVLSAPVASAAESKSKPRIYQDCGIGALVFGGLESDIGKIAAVISNITWDLGTTATSSAVTSPATCRGADATAAVYIQQNLKVVQEDIARGSGEHLAAVWTIYGCSPQLRSSLTRDVREAAGPVFSDRGYHMLPIAGQAEALWSTVADAVYAAPAGSCGV